MVMKETSLAGGERHEPQARQTCEVAGIECQKRITVFYRLGGYPQVVVTRPGGPAGLFDRGSKYTIGGRRIFGNIQDGPTLHLTQIRSSHGPLGRIHTGLDAKAQLPQRDHRSEDRLLTGGGEDGLAVDVA